MNRWPPRWAYKLKLPHHTAGHDPARAHLRRGPASVLALRWPDAPHCLHHRPIGPARHPAMPGRAEHRAARHPLASHRNGRSQVRHRPRSSSPCQKPSTNSTGASPGSHWAACTRQSSCRPAPPLRSHARPTIPRRTNRLGTVKIPIDSPHPTSEYSLGVPNRATFARQISYRSPVMLDDLRDRYEALSE